MVYEKIDFQNAGPPGISAERLAHMQTQYDEAAADLAAHNSASDPHPQYTTAAELATAVTAHEQASDPHPGYATDAALAAHQADDTHPHKIKNQNTSAQYYLKLDSKGLYLEEV